MSAPDKHKLILPPPEPTWFGDIINFIPKESHSVSSWFEDLQNFGKRLKDSLNQDKDQRYKHDYEIWKRTGGYKSNIVDFSDVKVSSTEINTLIAIKTEDTVQQQLDTKAETDDLGTMAYQDSDDVDISGGDIDGVDITNGTIDAADITNGTIDAADITNGTIDAADITNGTVDAAAITNGTVAGAAISGGSVTTTTITSSTIDETCTVEVQAGDSGSLVELGGVVYRDITYVGNVGAGEDDLMSYTVPADMLGTNGDIIEFIAYGVFANNANNKTLNIYFDGSLVRTGSASGKRNSWFVHGTIIRKTSTSIEGATLLTWDTSVSNTQTSAPAAIDCTTDSIFKFTGQGTANDDIVQRGLIVKWFGSHI